MLSIEKLKGFGANTDEALRRCMNNEAFYFRLIKMSVVDPNFERLRKALSDNDYSEAFEACHALKGVLGNLGLTPMFETADKLTEMLRPRAECACGQLAEELFASLEELKAIIGE